jgi:hypothetical protein
MVLAHNSTPVSLKLLYWPWDRLGEAESLLRVFQPGLTTIKMTFTKSHNVHPQEQKFYPLVEALAVHAATLQDVFLHGKIMCMEPFADFLIACTHLESLVLELELDRSPQENGNMDTVSGMHHIARGCMHRRDSLKMLVVNLTAHEMDQFRIAPPSALFHPKIPLTWFIFRLQKIHPLQLTDLFDNLPHARDLTKFDLVVDSFRYFRAPEYASEQMNDMRDAVQGLPRAVPRAPRLWNVSFVCPWTRNSEPDPEFKEYWPFMHYLQSLLPRWLILLCVPMQFAHRRPKTSSIWLSQDLLRLLPKYFYEKPS